MLLPATDLSHEELIDLFRGEVSDVARLAELRGELLRRLGQKDARREGAIAAMLGLEHDALCDMEGADGVEFERAEYVAGVARKRALMISAAKDEERWTKPSQTDAG